MHVIRVMRMIRLSTLLAGALSLLSVTIHAQAANTAGKESRDCELCPAMVWVPPGTFEMGVKDTSASPPKKPYSNTPAHTVSITYPLAVGRFEVTVREYARFIRETDHFGGAECEEWRSNLMVRLLNSTPYENTQGHWRDPGIDQNGDHPVVCVSWDDAQAYVQWLRGKTAQPYRLLTEAEWEYVARAGTTTRWPWGTDSRQQCRFANGADQQYSKSAMASTALCDDGHRTTAPVGSYAANAFGLNDLLGNAAEWTEDCWHETYAQAPADGSAAPPQKWCPRVVRGGAFDDAPAELSPASRLAVNGRSRRNVVGFRIARQALDPASPLATALVAAEDSTHWHGAATPSGIPVQSYLAHHPTGRFVTEAAARLAMAAHEFRDVLADSSPGPEMVRIPAGDFRVLKSERPSDADARVTIADSFAVGKYSVTNAEYFKCVADKKCRRPQWQEPVKDGLLTHSDPAQYYRPYGTALTNDAHPIVGVSWSDAMAYVAWLNEKRIDKQGIYRLLSETEWDYAARGGSATRWSHGDDEASLARYTWFFKDYVSDHASHAVGFKEPNGFGLYDMVGNVQEWVSDCFDQQYPSPSLDARARDACKSTGVKIIRGADYTARNAQLLRVSPPVRYKEQTESRLPWLGFRIAKTLH